MDRERWVIKTNKGRYVGIPFILSSGLKSFLDEKPVWNKTRTYHTRAEAEAGLAKYLSPANNHYVDKYSFEEGEKLDGVERVFV
ncbi:MULTISPECIES: hypothetical protein [unclassified Bacillus (in: firmicutes)]|uniref:hypothetical protein n=1 Tax=unclassified Bacillus (in: firmicutes) TaxID=185979 RepID=UPI00300FC699